MRKRKSTEQEKEAFRNIYDPNTEIGIVNIIVGKEAKASPNYWTAAAKQTFNSLIGKCRSELKSKRSIVLLFTHLLCASIWFAKHFWDCDSKLKYSLEHFVHDCGVCLFMGKAVKFIWSISYQLFGVFVFDSIHFSRIALNMFSTQTNKHITVFAVQIFTRKTSKSLSIVLHRID